jgi:hypothetical protein
MNHDMIAAGHPPLRFELASYEALLPRKHWDDRPRRMAESDYEVQLWAAGRIAAADAALSLLEGRAKRASNRATGDRSPWPELAESNCFACHQPLRGSGALRGPESLALNRQSLSWRTWDVSLSPLLLPRQQRDAKELPAPSLVDELSRLEQTMDSSLFPSPNEIVRLAAAARAALHSGSQVSAIGGILSPNGRPLDADAVLRGLASTNDAMTWDDACQRLATLVAVERSLYDRGLIDAANHQEFVSRMKIIAAYLRFRSADSEWPIALSSDGASNADALRKMDQLRAELAMIAAKEPSQ